MNIRSTSTKALAALTTVGLLTVGGASVAFAAGGAAGAAGGRAAVVREHPRALRNALKAAFSAAAETLDTTTEDLRAAMLDGPQSIASVAGAQAPEVAAAVEVALGARLDEAVAAGWVTPTRAERIRERIPAAAERIVNRVPVPRGA